ncbi:hypothetical protein PSHT_02516 [Puccinia striiformis]|uniref:Uncharacterized protein n=1 Tax=Puccinia striiformis TaxID=27350 RepID=A0A2S4WHT6_9BASI|nr:hypothetical protein PSHT_02516 [Puccinia striiformis]
MEGSIPDDAYSIYRMFVFYNRTSEIDAYGTLLPREAKKDLLSNTEAKMIALQDLVEREFPPQTSIVHPRIWSLRARGDGVLQKLSSGTPSVPKSVAKGQLRTR